MRISDWSSDVCSSDLADALGSQRLRRARDALVERPVGQPALHPVLAPEHDGIGLGVGVVGAPAQQVLGEVPPGLRKEAGAWHPVGVGRSEEHTSELQSLMRISSAVFCLHTNNYTYMIHSH